MANPIYDTVFKRLMEKEKALSEKDERIAALERLISSTNKQNKL
jgi:hypothetical protein